MNKISKIGWIGTGVMGKSMCKHLINKGYDISIFTRTASKASELIDMGAKFVNPDEIAKNCDAVFLMLGYPKDVDEMVLGDNGILNNMKKGSYLVDHTTSSPDLAFKIHNRAKELEIYSYDAPVSGGDIGAREARLVVMVGGEEENFSPVEEVMKAYSSKINLMGGAGKGQHTKMANQIIIASTMIGVVEGMLYASRANLDVEKVIQLLGGGAAGSFSLNVYGPRILKRDFEPGFYIEHFVKDLEICLAECEKMKLDLSGLKLAHKFYKLMMVDGLGKKGTQGLMLVLEKLNGIENNI
jgi:3-hydroxyisobutyrate dehydrogenase